MSKKNPTSSILEQCNRCCAALCNVSHMFFFFFSWFCLWETRYKWTLLSPCLRFHLFPSKYRLWGKKNTHFYIPVDKTLHRSPLEVTQSPRNFFMAEEGYVISQCRKVKPLEAALFFSKLEFVDYSHCRSTLICNVCSFN